MCGVALVELSGDDQEMILSALFTFQAWLRSSQARDETYATPEEAAGVLDYLEGLVVRLGGSLDGRYYRPGPPPGTAPLT